jgi:hypothetical protein
MSEAIALALLKMLLAEAPGVVLWVLRKAGLVPDDASHSDTIEPMRRVADIMDVNPMHKVRRPRPSIDPASGDYFPPEYEKP